jgi:hypothetical protein
MAIGRGVWIATLFALAAQGAGYRSIRIDESGRLHIMLDGGKEILAPKKLGQVSISEPAISADRQTVAWLGEYPDHTRLRKM